MERRRALELRSQSHQQQGHAQELVAGIGCSRARWYGSAGDASYRARGRVHTEAVSQHTTHCMQAVEPCMQRSDRQLSGSTVCRGFPLWILACAPKSVT